MTECPLLDPRRYALPDNLMEACVALRCPYSHRDNRDQLPKGCELTLQQIQNYISEEDNCE